MGGAEILSASLADQMCRLAAAVTVVFVAYPDPLDQRLIRASVPYSSLNLKRGRDLLRHPRMYANAITRCAPDGALVVERGFMGATLRMGGYRGPIVAVEHGTLLIEHHRHSPVRRLRRRLSRLAGTWAVDADVAVSDCMLDRMAQHKHARQIRRIYNGIDPEICLPIVDTPKRSDSELVVGFGGRLVSGKGADQIIRAVAMMASGYPTRLLIAGDGPERANLEGLARDLQITDSVEFLGFVDDMPRFWHRCDIAAITSDKFIESFSMVTLEAMACGKPVVAARNGAIPELMRDGVTGILVDSGDVAALTQALLRYAQDPELRRLHGAAARKRATDHFHIEDCARGYLDLFNQLAVEPR